MFHRLKKISKKLAFWIKQGVHPRNLSWTGWSVRFLGCRARRNDAEWSFHSKELQHRHAPQKPHTPPRSELTSRVKREIMKKFI